MRRRLAAAAYLLSANIPAIAASVLLGAPMSFPAGSLALTVALLWLGRALPARRWTAPPLALPVALVVLLNSLLAEAYYLSATGFGASFFYHVRFDLLFAGLREHAALIALAAIVLAVAVVGYGQAIGGKQAGRRGRPAWAAAAVAAALLVWQPLVGIASYLGGAVAYSRPHGIVAALLAPLAQPAPAAVLPASLERAQDVRLRRPQNLVVLYAESLERSYLDDEAFAALTPQLRGLRATSLDFADVMPGYAAGWTVAGLVATQCGYPLLNDPLLNLALARPLPKTEQPILPGAVCLGDVLKASGYRVVYVGGADARFAGKEGLLAAHGFDAVLGRREIGLYLDGLPDIDPDPAIGPWGYQDETMLAVAAHRFRSLAEAGDPFALFVLTLDTHHPKGLPSPSCAGPGEDPMRQSIRCTDRLLGAFIRAIRAGPHSDRTLIVVLSDHLAHRTSQTPLLPPLAERRLTFFANAPGLPPRVDAAAGAVFDVPATIVDLLGGGPTTIGAGQSLLRGSGFLHANGLQAHQQRYFLAPLMTARLRALWEEPGVDDAASPAAGSGDR